MWGELFNIDNPLISEQNIWMLMTVTACWVAFSIYAEQHWKWAERITGAIVALLGAMTMSNIGLIPVHAPFFDDIIWGFVVPLAIPLLLMNCDIKKIGKSSGRMLLLFVIGSVGTACGAVIATMLLGSYIPEAAGVAGMMTGSYIGGGVNFAALSAAFDVSGAMVSATTVADNLLMTLYFFVLIAIPSINFFRKNFAHPHVDAAENISADSEATKAAAYWSRKEISLQDIALNIALSLAIVAFSKIIAAFFRTVISDATPLLHMLNAFLGNDYLIITTISMLTATLGAEHIAKGAGMQEIGTWLIYLFFFVIGVPASISMILQNAPILLIFCAVIVVVNMCFCFIFGKLLRFDLEEILLVSNANIGGPTTAAALAISKGWVQLVGPIMLVGTLGYVIGTYFGIFIGNIL